MEYFDADIAREGFWQGDVILQPQEAGPDSLSLEPTGDGYVLAKGEATGHMHRIADTGKADLYKSGGALFLKIKEEVLLLHEEHKALLLIPGQYIVKQANEYDPWKDVIRNIRD